MIITYGKWIISVTKVHYWWAVEIRNQTYTRFRAFSLHTKAAAIKEAKKWCDKTI